MFFSGIQHKPFTFGTQELSSRMFQEQRAIAVMLIFPLSILIGQVSLRIVSKGPPLTIVRADIWNSLVRIVLADAFMELLQQSLSCVPFEDYEGDIQELVLQSMGYGCPLYARPLTPRAAIVVFGMRFLAVAVGVYFGEGWMPVAITGGVATGKSTVSTQFEMGYEPDSKTDEDADNDANDNNGKQDGNDEVLEPSPGPIDAGAVYVVDADKIGHSILLESTAGNVHSKLVSMFGDDILDEEGIIDRKRLGALIFNDATLRRRLNQITHPRIFYKMLQKLSWGLFVSGADITLVEIPLLFESGFITRSLFALTVVVTCSPEQQLERLMARNPELTEEECKARIASQMPIERKAKMADIVIANSGDQDSLANAVEEARAQIIWRLFGVGFTLFQIIAVMGLALPIAVYFRFYQSLQLASIVDGDH